MTMQEIEVRRISAEQTQPLRHAVLRPNQPPEKLVYPADEAPDTRHLGAWRGDDLVGIASIYPEPLPSADADGWWRLRGMATSPQARGRGIGRALLRSCLAHIAERNDTGLWCNARTSACGFYLALGFETIGDEFEIEGIGPHFVMARAVVGPSAQ